MFLLRGISSHAFHKIEVYYSFRTLCRRGHIPLPHTSPRCGLRPYSTQPPPQSNFPRYGPAESSVYCPPGFTDGEDGERNVIEGAWRTDDEQSTGMGHVACTSSNRYVIISMKCTFILPPPLLYTGPQHPSVTATETILQVPKVKCRSSTPMYGEHSELVPCSDKQYSIILIVIINFIIHNLNMFQNSYW